MLKYKKRHVKHDQIDVFSDDIRFSIQTRGCHKIIGLHSSDCKYLLRLFRVRIKPINRWLAVTTPLTKLLDCILML